MNSRTIIFGLFDQPVRKKVIKALVFHGIYLFLVLTGIILQSGISNFRVLTDINLVYWVFLCVIPIFFILVSETERYTRETLPLHTPPFGRPRCKLRDFCVMRTFRSFFRDASTLKQIVLYSIILFVVSPMGIIFFTKHSHFPLLWLMGIFFISMLCRYIWILLKLRTTNIVINDEGILLPAFGMWKMRMASIPWSSVMYLEIIGSNKFLYVDYSSFDEAISFIRGVIIHYKAKDTYLWRIERTRQKMCVITDALLGTKDLWKLYNYSNNYVGQQDIKLRLTYVRSPVYVSWEDEVSPLTVLCAETRLWFAMESVGDIPLQKRPIRSRLLVTKRQN